MLPERSQDANTLQFVRDSAEYKPGEGGIGSLNCPSKTRYYNTESPAEPEKSFAGISLDKPELSPKHGV